MDDSSSSKRTRLIRSVSFVVALSVFWLILFLDISDSFSRFFHDYSFGLFLIVLVLYSLASRLPDRHVAPVLLAGTMVLFALSLSYLWSSGFSDNFIIGGLLPYKDGKNYYFGANLILHGLSPVNAGQSTERPLFPGFLSFVLLLTGHNLKVAIALIAQLAGFSLYLSVQRIRKIFGPLTAGLFATFLYFFIQPWIGYSMSEMLGFTLGCFGFTMLWLASNRRDRSDLFLGLVVLMLAVSARAGAFFIFPMLAVWAGWVFRGDRGFSIRTFLLAISVIVAGYLLVNLVYPRLLGIPPGSSFGNFSYALYGQVRGGAGWHSAIEELGTRDPSVVYRAAWQYFLDHPIGLFIGVAKAYRDFFLFGDQSIFPFGEFVWRNWLNILLWMAAAALLVLGLVRSLSEIRQNDSSLLIAGFVGMVLSIPFLPPVDGGARFYASTAPFFYILPALGIRWFQKDQQSARSLNGLVQNDILASRYASIGMILLTLIAPPVLHSLAQEPGYTLPACPAGQASYVMEYHPGSYVDFVKSGSGSCGYVPEVCRNDFENNNVEKATDDFCQFLFKAMATDGACVRLIPAIDYVNDRFHYFYAARDRFPGGIPTGVVSGCAIEILTKNQTIYQVESMSLEEK